MPKVGSNIASLPYTTIIWRRGICKRESDLSTDREIRAINTALGFSFTEELIPDATYRCNELTNFHTYIIV